ncbi:histidine kinase [Paenibacillus sp. J2TS4]|uniref:sensor histidine kinase n=1 Tax=Paenibacillus sp. J2TS4 TaxID=2807194 RepID=UPI001B197C16|nr:histidine kinase [Paenibacillus sp. J2TS4]GIP34124.1 sensor histidine kinase YesM [Paenibacillus sp. J2TS4]
MNLHVKLTSLYSKLFLAFLIVIVPIYVISLTMNEYGEKTIRKEVKNSMQSRVNFYIRLLENEFNRIIHMQKAFVNDRELRMLSTAAAIMGDIEYRDTVYTINSRLKAMMNSSVYIADADVFLPKEDRIITAVSFYEKMPHDKFKALKAVSSRPRNPFVFWDGRLFVSFPYSDLALINKEEPVFLLSAEISQTEIAEVLERMKIGSSGGAMIIGQQGEWAIASEDDKDTQQVMLKLLSSHSGVQSAGDFDIVEIDGKRNWVSFDYSPSLGIALFMHIPEEEMLGSQARYRLWFWMLSGISLLVVAVFSFWIFRQVHLPMKRLVRAFHRVEDGNLVVTIREDRSDEFSYLYKQFNTMVKRINELIHEVYEQKYRANLSELRQLQSQISPHFLYNSFFILSRMAKYENYESITKLSNYLGSYFRYVTRTNMEEVPLKEEVSFARTYVQIQTFRFEDRIRVEYSELPKEFEMISIPRLILQPIVENVYEHGLKNKVKDGLLRVTFMKSGEQLIIAVEDNGEGMQEAEFLQLLRKLDQLDGDMETTGLVNVHRRLKLRYGPASGLRLSRTAAGGFKVEICLPIK